MNRSSDTHPPRSDTRGNGHGRNRRASKRRSGDPLNSKLDAVCDALSWLSIRMSSPAAERLTFFDMAMLFVALGECFCLLADRLGRDGILTPKTVQQIHLAYDQGYLELEASDPEIDL